MSAITIESDLVHYEVLGRGRPVIFVHGWLGSWRYWVPTMQYLSAKYRVYALDLWGFGDSGKDNSKYTLQAQVQLLFGFFERLGIPKAALIGHSLGAAVCLSFARQHPDRAYRMMLISPPLFDQGNIEDLRGDAAAPPAASPLTTTAPAAAASPVAVPPVTAPSAAVPPAAGSVPPAAGSVPAATGSVPPAAVPPATGTAAPQPPAQAPVAAGAAPAPSAPTESTPAPAQAPAAAPGSAAPTAASSPVVTPALTPPAAPQVMPIPTPTTAPAGTQTPPTPPAASAGTAAPVSDSSVFSSSAETLPRNPFRSRGETPEEILARLRARSTGVQPQAGSSSSAPGTPASGESARPSAPVLPTGIARPIMPPTPITTPATPSTPPVSKAANNPLIAIFAGAKPGALLIKYARQDVPDWESLRTEVEKTDEKALTQSAQSFDGFNMSMELRRVSAPTLLLHGEDDGFLAPPPLEMLRRIDAAKQPGQFLSMIEPGMRHFPMIEVAAKFNRLLVDFLEAPDLSNIQFKDQWKRTVR